MPDQNPEIEPIQSQPCPNCGAQEYIWGHLTFNGMAFKLKSISSRINFKFVPKQDQVHARRCKKCGNLQLFVAPTEQ